MRQAPGSEAAWLVASCGAAAWYLELSMSPAAYISSWLGRLGGDGHCKRCQRAGSVERLQRRRRRTLGLHAARHEVGFQVALHRPPRLLLLAPAA